MSFCNVIVLSLEKMVKASAFLYFILFMEARTISTTSQVQHVHLLLKFKTYMDILHSHMYYYTQLQHLSKYIISFI